MKYKSITTPNVMHDEANALTELIILNKDILIYSFPWKPLRCVWGQTVSAIKKLMSPSFSLTADQIAFYIYRCCPTQIDSKEFAKVAVVAKKLLQKQNLSQLMETYRNRRLALINNVTENAEYKKVVKPKSLLDLLKELENGKE